MKIRITEGRLRSMIRQAVNEAIKGYIPNYEYPLFSDIEHFVMDKIEDEDLYERVREYMYDLDRKGVFTIPVVVERGYDSEIHENYFFVWTWDDEKVEQAKEAVRGVPADDSIKEAMLSCIDDSLRGMDDGDNLDNLIEIDYGEPPGYWDCH